jgi:hypothetical protein
MEDRFEIAVQALFWSKKTKHFAIAGICVSLQSMN